MKPWRSVDSVQETEVSSIPIWIQLADLELKYWGEKSLFKIVSSIGTPIRVDHFIKERNRLAYPQILIEIKLAQTLVEQLQFEDEFGEVVNIGVRYEWRPVICAHCRGVGHETDK